MKQSIFKIFTLDNKIMLTKETIKFLESNITDKEILIKLALRYKEKYGIKTCTVSELKLILDAKNKNESKFFDIVNIKKSNMSYKEKYTHLRKKIPYQTTFIYNLKINKTAYIFGIYYKNREGEDIIEDELNNIKIIIRGKNLNVFLVADMFVCCYGILQKGMFYVDQIFLPEIKKRENVHDYLSKKDVMIIFFSGLVELQNFKKIIRAFEFEPEIVVFSSLFGENVFNFVESISTTFPKINFILVPDIDQGLKSWLPKPFINDSRMKAYKNKNVYFATNPCEIHLHNRKIIVIRDDIVKKLKSRGIFHGEDHILLLENLLFSQYSYNFLEMPYHFYEDTPDLFMISEDFFGIAHDNGLFNLVVNGDFEKDNLSFVVYDSSTNVAELSSLKG